MIRMIPHNWFSSSRGPYRNQRTPDYIRLSLTKIFYIGDGPCHEANPIWTLAFTALHNQTFSAFHNWDGPCHGANPIQTLASQLFRKYSYCVILTSLDQALQTLTHIHFPSPFTKTEERTNIPTCNTFTSLPQTHTRLVQNILSYNTPKTP